MLQGWPARGRGGDALVPQAPDGAHREALERAGRFPHGRAPGGAAVEVGASRHSVPAHELRGPDAAISSTSQGSVISTSVTQSSWQAPNPPGGGRGGPPRYVHPFPTHQGPVHETSVYKEEPPLARACYPGSA